MTPDLSSRVELAILKPEALSAEVHKIVADAMQTGCAGVCVAPVWVARVARMVQGTGVRVGSVVGFPHGTSKSTLKAIEATSTIKEGAEAIDVVAHLPHMISLDLDATRAELMEIVRAARSTRRDVVINVIVETALLLQLGDRVERAFEVACRATRESGCDGIVTASGFHHGGGGAKPQAVALLKRFGESLIIKAAGGITTEAHARAMLDGGADRVRIDPSMREATP